MMYMKKAFLPLVVLCCIGLIAGCKGGAENQDAADTFAGSNTSNIDTVSQYKETKDIYVDGKQTEYVLISPCKGCFDSVHNVENDSVAWGDFGFADGLWYYLYECSQKLQSMGVKYHETSADKTVFCQGDVAYRPQDSCDYGVLIVKPDCRFEFVDLTYILFGQDYSEQYIYSPIKHQHYETTQPD